MSTIRLLVGLALLAASAAAQTPEPLKTDRPATSAATRRLEIAARVLRASAEASPDHESNSEETTDDKADQTPATTSERIVDKPMRPGVGRALARIPLYPFIGVGKAFEKGMRAVEEKNLILKQAYAAKWLADRHIELLFGGMGTGTGMAVGINFFDDDFLGSPRLEWELPLRVSTSKYQQYETRLQFALLPEHRLFVEGNARYRHRPEEDFFGQGPATLNSDRSNYKMQDRSIGASLGSEFGRGHRVSFDALYVNAKVANGADQDYPDTIALFPTLAGIPRGSALIKYGVSAVIPWLDHPGDPHRGVRFRARAYRLDSRNSDNFNFNEYAASGEFYIPLGGPRTLAIRALGDFRDPRNGGSVPFYALPFLGGSRTMRGFREFRFHDNNAVLFNLEYRWKVWKLADFALFLDEGQVAPRIRDIQLDGFRTSYGGGVRLKGASGMALRFDVGHSKEGFRYYFSFGPEW